jgi:hypothetical protein
MYRYVHTCDVRRTTVALVYDILSNCWGLLDRPTAMLCCGDPGESASKRG